MADAEEIGNFFSEAANENADELMDELDEMLAEDAMNEMEDVPMSNIPINPGKAKVQPSAAKPAA